VVRFLLNPTVLLIAVNLIVLIALPRIKRPPVRWTLFFHLLIFDSFIVYVALSLDPRYTPSIGTLLWVAVWLVALAALFWGGLAFVSLFLLPVNMKTWRDGRWPARALIGFVRGANHPFYAFDADTNALKKRYDGKLAAKEGGLGLMLLRSEHAVVLHKGAKLTGVAGGDIVFTERLERELDLLDLKKYILIILDGTAVTKDGISIKIPAFVPCQIAPPKGKTADDRLYPFDPDTIAKVVRAQDVLDGQKRPWYRFVVQKTRKVAFDVISQYTFDQLYADKPGVPLPRDEIRARIHKRLVNEMKDTGIDIIFEAIGNIEPDDPANAEKSGENGEDAVSIARRQVERWQAGWQRQAAAHRAKGQAEAIKIVEKARAKALADLIQKVGQGFRDLQKTNTAADERHIIALSFINAVEQMLSQQNLPRTIEGGSAPQTFKDIRRLIETSGKE